MKTGANYFLGAPNTRSASCVTSSTRVTRDPFYTGANQEERCTVVSRVAQTFLRFDPLEVFQTEDPDSYPDPRQTSRNLSHSVAQ
ncbi:hypothetical protein T484DRAFT_1830562 [Baffinella frigidus]|nr:hypothetical protein T484DRAFT_1830562 [Cryptophyta sp. CCMP2293]